MTNSRSLGKTYVRREVKIHSFKFRYLFYERESKTVSDVDKKEVIRFKSAVPSKRGYQFRNQRGEK